MLPPWALASPHPVKPHSVSMRTNVASNEVVRPKSLVCCFSDGIGMCTQYPSTDRIFMTAIRLPWLGIGSGNLAGYSVMGQNPNRSPRALVAEPALILFSVQIHSVDAALTSPPRFPVGLQPTDLFRGEVRDPLLPWAPAFAAVAGSV